MVKIIIQYSFIFQDNEGLVKRIMEVEQLVNDALSHRKSIMARLDTYGDDYRSVPVVIPSEAEAASTVRASQPSILTGDKKAPGKKRKLTSGDASTVAAAMAPTSEIKIEPASTPPVNKQQSKRDKSLPKRPHNAFFYFSQERRPALQKEMPHLSKKEIANVLSQKWNDLPPREKEIYLQLQNERKRQYQVIMAQYNQNKETLRSEIDIKDEPI